MLINATGQNKERAGWYAAVHHEYHINDITLMVLTLLLLLLRFQNSPNFVLSSTVFIKYFICNPLVCVPGVSDNTCLPLLSCGNKLTTLGVITHV